MSPLERGLQRSLRRTQEKEIKLGPARLHLDDLREVYEALREFDETAAAAEKYSLHPPGTVSLLAGDAKAATFDDLKDATPEELDHVMMSSLRNGKFFVISLSPHLAVIKVAAGDGGAVDLAEDMAKHINARKSWRHTWTLNGFFLWPSVVGLSFYTALLALYLAQAGPPTASGVLSFVLPILTFALWDASTHSWPRSTDQ